MATIAWLAAAKSLCSPASVIISYKQGCLALQLAAAAGAVAGTFGYSGPLHKSLPGPVAMSFQLLWIRTPVRSSPPSTSKNKKENHQIKPTAHHVHIYLLYLHLHR